MQADQINQLIEKILADVEEEDIGISLLSRHYQNQEELAFFNEADRDTVFRVLEKISQDSQRHKKLLYELVDFFGSQMNGSTVS